MGYKPGRRYPQLECQTQPLSSLEPEPQVHLLQWDTSQGLHLHLMLDLICRCQQLYLQLQLDPQQTQKRNQLPQLFLPTYLEVHQLLRPMCLEAPQQRQRLFGSTRAIMAIGSHSMTTAKITSRRNSMNSVEAKARARGSRHRQVGTVCPSTLKRCHRSMGTQRRS